VIKFGIRYHIAMKLGNIQKLKASLAKGASGSFG
jgi:hypothetical protein